MRYFILLPEDSEEDVDYSTNILGEVSYKNFCTEENKNYTVEQFLEKIKELRIIKNG